MPITSVPTQPPSDGAPPADSGTLIADGVLPAPPAPSTDPPPVSWTAETATDAT